MSYVHSAQLLQLCLTLCNLMDCNPPGSSVHGISQEEYWNGLRFPSPGDLPNPGIEPASFMSPALAGRFFTTSTTSAPQRSTNNIPAVTLGVGFELERSQEKLIFAAALPGKAECVHGFFPR